ncbi:MAG: HAMP domain-containing histidine kinase [Proteobacteria bacterium]|nr:HAMP domain-containing histidine kinase [Pseudomonadota bacterium]
MKRIQPPKTYSSIPWIIAFCALLSSFANLTTGIILLASNSSGGDIALGVLTVVFAVWGISGSVLALIFIVRQNRYNRSQANFIAQVSHELRTPITSIRMYADTLMLHRYKDEAEEAELIQHMDEEILRLERLTEQILEARQQKIAKDPDEVSALDPAQTLENALKPFLDAPENEDRIDLAIDSDLPRLHIDEDDFMNATSNLIRNALTHGGPGRIHVSLKSIDGKCVFSVRDEGTGIPKEWQKQIFEPFERGFNTTESGIPGFGLGLSIVKDFAKQYNADLSVDNHPEGGAIFTLAMTP